MRAGRWADRGRQPEVTGLALALLVGSWWFIAQADSSLVLLVVGVVMLDFAVQAVHVSSQSLVVAAAPEAAARIIGSYMVFYSLGSALGAVSAAWVFQAAGWGWTSALGATYAATAAAIWMVNHCSCRTRRTSVTS